MDEPNSIGGGDSMSHAKHANIFDHTYYQVTLMCMLQQLLLLSEMIDKWSVTCKAVQCSRVHCDKP